MSTGGKNTHDHLVRRPGSNEQAAAAVADGTLEPADVAQTVCDATHEEQSLITPHAEVLENIQHKAKNQTAG